MKRQLITSALFLALMLSGCGMMQPQTPYPWLESGIGLTEMQIMLQNEYDQTYQFVNNESKQKLEQEVKPMLLESQGIIHRYNRAVLMDLPTAYTEQEIILILRQVGRKIVEVKNES